MNKVTILPIKYFVIEVRITILFRLSHSWIKYKDLVSVENFYTADFKMLWQHRIIEVPIFILKVPETFANAPALYLEILTKAAVSAIRY